MVSSGSRISHLSAGFILVWWYSQNTNSHSRWILILYMFLRKKFMFRVKMKSKWYHSVFHVINYERKNFNTGSVFQAFSLRKRISIAERKGRIVTFFLCFHCLESAYCLGLYVCGSAIHWWLNSALSSFSCVLRLWFPIFLSVVLIMREILGQYVLHFLCYWAFFMSSPE